MIVKEYKESKIGNIFPDAVAKALKELPSDNKWRENVDIEKLKHALTD